MEGFEEYGKLHRSVKVYLPWDKFATSLEFFNKIVELFSPETMPDLEEVEVVIHSLLPTTSVFLNESSFKAPFFPFKVFKMYATYTNVCKFESNFGTWSINFRRPTHQEIIFFAYDGWCLLNWDLQRSNKNIFEGVLFFSRPQLFSSNTLT